MTKADDDNARPATLSESIETNAMRWVPFFFSSQEGI
jgi:hypothetical protein